MESTLRVLHTHISLSKHTCVYVYVCLYIQRENEERGIYSRELAHAVGRGAHLRSVSMSAGRNPGWLPVFRS